MCLCEIGSVCVCVKGSVYVREGEGLCPGRCVSVIGRESVCERGGEGVCEVMCVCLCEIGS